MQPSSRWHWRRWQAPALLGLGLGAAWFTQLGWVTVVGVVGYLLVLLLDLRGEGRRPSDREIAGLAAGALAVVSTALVTTFWRPIAFPLNFLLSLALGGAMQFGLLNMLGPAGPHDLVDGQATAEYQAILSAMQAIGDRVAAASRQPKLPQATVGQLKQIFTVVGLIESRYQQRVPDFAGASATLTILQQFDKILAYYLKIKSGEQFVDSKVKGREVAETEGRTIPMFNAALARLGRQLDAGEVLDKSIAEDALESMLQSLNLIDDLTDDPRTALAAPSDARAKD